MNKSWDFKKAVHVLFNDTFAVLYYVRLCIRVRKTWHLDTEELCLSLLLMLKLIIFLEPLLTYLSNREFPTHEVIMDNK